MSVELSVVSEVSVYKDESNYKEEKIESNLHMAIFSLTKSSSHFAKDATIRKQYSEVDYLVRKVALQKEIAVKPCEVKGSTEAKVTFEWGGEESKTTFEISAEVHDDTGNYLEAEVKQDSDGKGSASVSAGHEESK